MESIIHYYHANDISLWYHIYNTYHQIVLYLGEIYFQDALKIVLASKQILPFGSKASGPD
jgi:hypothetical protein